MIKIMFAVYVQCENFNELKFSIPVAIKYINYMVNNIIL